jgi:hypothetical protein
MWMTARPVKVVWHTFRVRVAPALLAAGLLLTLARFDVPPPADRDSNLDRMLAGKQFDFAGWWLGAMAAKIGHELTLPQNSMTERDQIEFVREYAGQITAYQQLETQITRAFIDPNNADPQGSTAGLRAERQHIRAWLSARQNLAEAIIQEQVESVLRDEGFALGGQVMPPLRFRFTELPDLLIVSRRDRIERIASRELATGLPVDEQDRVESQVDKRFDVSSIVEPIGGLGAYPTMLPETPAMVWLLGVAGHEWVHNYFLYALAPIGWNYGDDPHARIMNETAAVIAEREIRQRVAERFYPDLLSAIAGQEKLAALSSDVSPATDPPKFDFRKEMRETRLRADELLAQGKIEEAERYMEQRRQVFVQNGHLIRKLNQAYFAFHGAYNADPGGSPAAGKDPVGPAVQQLRDRSASMGDFLRSMATVQNLDDLQRRLK